RWASSRPRRGASIGSAPLYWAARSSSPSLSPLGHDLGRGPERVAAVEAPRSELHGHYQDQAGKAEGADHGRAGGQIEGGGGQHGQHADRGPEAPADEQPCADTAAQDGGGQRRHDEI